MVKRLGAATSSCRVGCKFFASRDCHAVVSSDQRGAPALLLLSPWSGGLGEATLQVVRMILAPIALPFFGFVPCFCFFLQTKKHIFLVAGARGGRGGRRVARGMILASDTHFC